jgi:hypothetical protein
VVSITVFLFVVPSDDEPALIYGGAIPVDGEAVPVDWGAVPEA